MSAATYAQLVEAGAPELPEGYFYAVRVREDYSFRVSVQVRRHARIGWRSVSTRKSAWFGLDEIPKDADLGNLPDVVTDFAAQLARSAWNSIAEGVAAQQRYDAVKSALDAVSGDHP